MLKRFVQFIEYATTGVGVVAAWLVLPLIAATGYEVFSRYALGAPTIWAYDVGYMLTGSHFLLGGALTLKCNAHIRIDVLYSKFSPKKQALVDALAFAIIAIPFSYLLSVALWNYAIEAYQTKELSGESAWNPVVWPFRMVFFAGFAILTLQSVAEVLKACIGLRAEVEVD